MHFSLCRADVPLVFIYLSDQPSVILATPVSFHNERVSLISQLKSGALLCSNQGKTGNLDIHFPRQESMEFTSNMGGSSLIVFSR